MSSAEYSNPFDCFGYSFTLVRGEWRGETADGAKIGPFKTAVEAYAAAKAAFLALAGA